MMPRPFVGALTLSMAAALTIAVPYRVAAAQTAAEHVAMGDHADSAMDSPTALKHYEEALAVDSLDYDALWKAARECVDLGEFAPDKQTRNDFYLKGEAYGRRAVGVNPNDAWGHFQLARALGRRALTLGVRDRIKYAKDVRAEALAALKVEPNNAGALHVMGVWNAEIMRLNGFNRFIAKNFLGGDVFGEASWDKAEDYMEKSVAAEPGRLVHYLDQGKIYRDSGDKAKAKEAFEKVINGVANHYNDSHYKDEAKAALKELE
jgi:tetratricopeptide (TPR) repeat protein